MRKRLLGMTALVALAFATAAPRAQAAGILSQGANAGLAPVAASVTSMLASEQQANSVAVQAGSQLSRITMAMQSMQNLQTAARNIAVAAPNTVPDGLQSNGLEPDSGIKSPGVANPVSSWVNAQTPTQTTAAGQTNVSINQTAAQALLSWNTFNVSKNTTVTFNQQGNTNWVALNQIKATGVPSQIMGSIKASGQVYLINQNGIIFGGASQINVGSLVASSANINLTNSQFLAGGGIYSAETNLTYTPSFINAGGPVTVQPGAEIATSAPAAVTTGGGFVLMMGSTVQNGGSISTPGGQTELAAGDNFLIRSGYSTNGNATSTTRGNEIEPEITAQGSSLTGGSGLVVNTTTGVITAATGDITLAGETVQQNGLAVATTSVAVRGTIHLLTSANDPKSSVTLGAGATTLVDPELSSTDTELDSQRAALIADSATANAGRAGQVQATPQFDDLSLLPDQQENSRIEIVTGGTAHFEDGSDTATAGGQLAVSATKRVQVDTGALLDVSGSNIAMPMSSNDIAVNIQNYELRDNPQNRLTGILSNANIFVDERTLSAVPASSADSNPRDYTAGGLFEVSGYLANVGHTIGEYTSIGGTIDLSTGAKGAIVSQNGSVFDINGGTLQYQSGELAQSYLMGSDGRIYNVNNAPAGISYTGVFNGFTVNHPSWGPTQTYANVLSAPSEVFESGYTVGRAAGSLTLSSPTTIFDGAIHAGAVNGPSQIAADPTGVTDPYLYTQSEIAEPGSLIIASLAADASATTALATDVEFGTSKEKAVKAGKRVPSALIGTTVFDASTINNAGLGGLQIITRGSIDVAAALKFAPGAAVTLDGSSVDIAANVTDPGGSVSASQIVTLNGTPGVLAVTKPSGNRVTGHIVLGAGDTINTAGVWTNLVTNPAITFTQAFVNGGAVNLTSATGLTLGKNSRINSSAGGVESITGKVTGGAGGNITLQAAATPTGFVTGLTGKLTLNGTLDAVGVTHGGVLTLEAPAFLIGASSAEVAAEAAAGVDLTKLRPALFSSGFSAYNLLSTGDIMVAPGTQLNITEPTYLPADKNTLARTGVSAASVFKLGLAPLYVANSSDTAISQRAGASFNATIYSPGAVTASNGSVLSIGDGASIKVDPGQAIDLRATGQITIDGNLTAPGGAITAVSSFNPDVALPGGPGTVSVWVGSGATLDTSAKAVSFANALGNRISLAPAGGSITLGSDLSTASIIIRQGAVLAASGSAAADEVAATALSSASGNALTPGQAIPVEGAGGAISLASAEGIYNDGLLTAEAGGPDAAGGSLSMALEADVVPNAGGTAEATPRIFNITQQNPGAQLAADLQPGASDGLQIGTASISAAQITKGGFGSVTLFARDAFLFKGNVTLSAAQSIKLEEGVEADTSRTGSVTLNAPYVLLSGQSFDTTNGAVPIPFAVITGYSAQNADGTFTVNAVNIDISDGVRFGGILPADGTVAASDLAGFGTVNLNSSGDLQFLPNTAYTGAATTVSNLSDIITTADVNLTAREIYVTGAPLTGTTDSVSGLAPAGMVVAGYDPGATGNNGTFDAKGVLTINRSAGTTPVAPDVLLGSLTFEAATINQGGVIWQPLGAVSFGNLATGATIDRSTVITGDPKAAVNFLPGSITSISAAGLNIPFGGTTDGVNYDVIGQAAAGTTTAASDPYGLNSVTGGAGTGKITVAALSTDIEAGATLDLRGGGTLSGAGFIAGEGGSVDVLTAPLLNTGSSAIAQPGLASDAVYAIVKGAQPTSAVAYTETGATGSTPALGSQIVIPAGVPGLPAGTYTLLPASYALEKGGYRVEVDGNAALNSASVTALPNGSYAVAGYSALAGTNVHATLPSNLTITPAATVLNYADYDQESYSSFLVANAASIGAVRPVLPADGGTLVLSLPASSRAALFNAGSVSFAAAAGGIGGTLQITGPQSNVTSPDIDIYGATLPAKSPAGTIVLSADQIDAFNPYILEIGAAGGGGTQAYINGITLENGATLKAARVVLTANAGGITLDGGSKITTIGQGLLPSDSSTQGQLSNKGASVLDVGNGYLTYSTATSQDTDYGPIDIQNGAKIYTDGSIAFSTSAAVTIGVAASLGGRYLDLALPEINIGSPQALAAGNAPSGLDLTPSVLQALTQGIPDNNVPALQILNLTAFDSLNFFGNTSLDLSGSDVELEINTPAIYGHGGAGAVASINASTIVWNGIVTTDPTDPNATTLISSLPGGTVAGGPGSGSGTLDLNAQTILLGYSGLDVPQAGVLLARLTAGFSTVNLNASSEITANNAGSLAVYQKVPTYNQPGKGGTLNLNTPLLTAADGASIAFTAGGDLNLTPGAGAPATSLAGAAGGTIDLTAGNNNSAGNIVIGSAIILPSGKLDLQATNDITLGTESLISLAGATTTNVDQTVYGFGGNLIMASAAGNITQQSGSVIDVSAVNNTAGSVTITADAGQAALNGTLLGSSTGALAGSDTSGVFSISAHGLGGAPASNDDLFAALNNNLNAGGFFETRDFDIKQGDLTIDGGVQAHNVSVSLDHGSLIVAGRIDASGNGGGSISLAASGDLMLMPNAYLDAHGTVLQADSSGQSIASENEPVISLTTEQGKLTLDGGATIDVSPVSQALADGVPGGDLELNAPRTGTSVASATDKQTITDPLDGNVKTGANGPSNAQGDDVAISAAGPLNIMGAATIALNGFATYANAPTDPNNANGQIVDQAYLDLINTDSTAFENTALSNTALQANTAGLTAYGSAYQLRPGVTIEAAAPNGDISVNGDLNLVGYRYGAGAVNFDPDTVTTTPANAGAGQPGVLNIRAPGNLNIYGSVTDGFDTPISDAGTEFAKGWVIYSSEPFSENQVIPTPIAIAAGSVFSDSAAVNFPVPIGAGTFVAGAVAPVALTLSSSQTVTTGFIATSDITAGHKTYLQGQMVPAGSVLPAGTTIAVGGRLPFAVAVDAVLWPANTPFTVLTTSSGVQGVVVASALSLQAGSFIPAGSALIFPSGDADDRTRPVIAGTQGQLYGLAAQLPAGDKSWSIGLVSGADLTAANPNTTQAANALGSAGNLVLADTHYGIKGNTQIPAFSVIRTGTGALSLVSGGSIDEDSSFGIYTAGTSSTATNLTGSSPYYLPQGDQGAGGTLLGKNNTAASLAADYTANYPINGGNVLVSADGDLSGFIFTSNSGINNSDAIGNWLWRQGGNGLPTAWWVEYGTLNEGPGAVEGANSPVTPQYTGFQGIGTLGGGNLTVNAGGNASGLDLVVASSGQVQSDGTVMQNGGGALNVTIGGAVNFVEPGSTLTYTSDAGGLISDLRGNSTINAGSIGTVLPDYGTSTLGDIRFLSPYDSEQANFGNGIELAPGDGTVAINSRGNLVVDSVDNPGTVGNMENVQSFLLDQNGVDFTPSATDTGTSGVAVADFSLWNASTGVNLFSAGGDVSPAETTKNAAVNANDFADTYYPPNLTVTAQNGNIYFGSSPVELAPSPDGQLELLAADSIIGDNSLISMSGAALSLFSNPSDPAYTLYTGPGAKQGLYATNISALADGSPNFGADTPTGALHASDPQPARIYAATGDILQLAIGQLTAATTTNVQLILAAKPFDVFAGRDIVDSGTILAMNDTHQIVATITPDIFLNLSNTDISTVTAGRDIIESSFDIAGPGQLVVQAGGNYKALAAGVIDSIGPIFDIDPNNRDSGAGVALLAGTGATGPNYSGFAEEFIDPASTSVILNTVGVNIIPTIVQQEDGKLYTWLQATTGYTGTAADAYAYFQTLPANLQDVFIRQAYFDVLDTSGTDYNSGALDLAKTYILGRTAVAALFPATNAAGLPITYAGDITMYGDSGVHTDFGGDIETLTPGGATTVGVEGTTPPASAGIITQGNGNIEMYALSSVELGESRVLTTFGGNIVIWSTQGDINAGRGSKTTIDFTPLQRLYDNYGDVFLSPNTPSSGAGIATLSPIPSVAAGNIDLIAPLGTIDAGEAGIRSSGKTNVAALVVLNSANISSKGGTTGAPTTAAPNVGALTSASSAAGAATAAAEGNAGRTQAAPQPSIWIVEILGYGGDQNEPSPKKKTQHI